MKSITSHRISLAALGLLAALASPLSAESTRPVSVDRGQNRPSAIPRNYETDRPVDRDNKSVDTDAVDASELTRGDLRLIKKTAANSAYETAISRQATTRASNADVRAYADQMVRDHEAMDRDLAAVTTHPGRMTRPDTYRDELDDLAQKTGNDYDEAYLDDMVDAHEDGIRLLEDATESDNAKLAAFAAEHLPTLREHLARAKQLEELVDD